MAFMSINQLKKEFSYFEKIANTLYTFHLQSATDKQIRLALQKYIKELNRFERLDENKRIKLKLKGMPEQLDTLVEIFEHDGKIVVDIDRLCSHMFGIKESIEEAYNYSMMED